MGEWINIGFTFLLANFAVIELLFRFHWHFAHGSRLIATHHTIVRYYTIVENQFAGAYRRCDFLHMKTKSSENPRNVEIYNLRHELPPITDVSWQSTLEFKCLSPLNWSWCESDMEQTKGVVDRKRADRFVYYYYPTTHPIHSRRLREVKTFW